MTTGYENQSMYYEKSHRAKKTALPRIISDHLGSIRVVLNEQGNVDSWSDYYPFGKESRGSSTSNEPKEQFTGKERDIEIGLDYFGARYYNSEIGRWTSVDPMKQYPSPYIYVGNNPVRMVDPYGLEAIPSGCTGIKQETALDRWTKGVTYYWKSGNGNSLDNESNRESSDQQEEVTNSSTSNNSKHVSGTEFSGMITAAQNDLKGPGTLYASIISLIGVGDFNMEGKEFFGTLKKAIPKLSDKLIDHAVSVEFKDSKIIAKFDESFRIKLIVKVSAEIRAEVSVIDSKIEIKNIQGVSLVKDVTITTKPTPYGIQQTHIDGVPGMSSDQWGGN